MTRNAKSNFIDELGLRVRPDPGTANAQKQEFG
jgi:hypothetical protein